MRSRYEENIGYRDFLCCCCRAASVSDGPAKSSPELHATRYASGVMEAMQPQFGVSRTEAYNKILPLLKETYQKGKQDCEARVSEAVAKQH
ncbi:Exc2 family lipoprotein [Serratia nevei]|nr:Exc2 family lipoprotein [Serratia nevei]